MRAHAASTRAPVSGEWRPDARAWLVAASVALAAAAAALARVALVGHGSLGFLVGAGHRYSDPSLVPSGLPVRRGTGYDGQFMYRLAHDPFDWSHRSLGIRLDGAFRFGRIGYPFVVWLVSLGGRPALLPAALLLVGLASLTALAFLGARSARSCGLGPGWGLLICWPGLLFSIDFDLAESLEVALVVAGLLAVRAGRPGWAAAALSGAVLTRETALVAVAAVAVSRLRRLWRQRRLERIDLAWAMPIAAFAFWQLLCRARLSRLPITSDASSNAQAPLRGLINAWPRWQNIARLHPGGALLHAVEVVVLVGLVVTALCLARRYRSVVGVGGPSRGGEAAIDPVALTVAFGTAAALCVSTAVWASGSDLRMFADIYAAAGLVLLPVVSRRVRVGWAAVLLALAVAVALYRAFVV